MHLVNLDRVTKRYAEKVPLRAVSLGIDRGQRVGVIGLNGSGKSTLLRLVAGSEEPDEGRATWARDVTVAAVGQQPDLDPDAAVLDVAAGPGAGEERRRSAAAVLDRLGFREPSHERPGVPTDALVGTLSGGQRMRVAIARALAADPDLLVLDEPTNHLDPDAVEWLEEHLLARRGATLFVTHDRYLLDSVATRIVEVVDASLVTFHGSFGDYLIERARRTELEDSAARTRANLARRELEWLRRSPSARTGKARYRVEQAEALIASTAKVADSALTLDLPARRLGSLVATLHRAGKRYGDRTVVRQVDLKVPPHARWGLVGPNGSGKTTLLGLVAGRLDPDEGSVRLGGTVHVGWYGQDPTPMAPRTRVVDAVREVALRASTVEGLSVSAEDLLERFLFDRDSQRAWVEELSGGERRRLELLRVLADAPNLLLLDEPTNDLDLDTLAALADYLDRWPGALLVASHDRWFLDRVCTDLFALQPDGALRHQPGGWSAWRAAAAESPTRERERVPSRKASPQSPTKLTFNEQRELTALEARIPELEQRRDDLQTELEVADYRRAAELGAELTATVAALDEAEERWLVLSERAAP